MRELPSQNIERSPVAVGSTKLGSNLDVALDAVAAGVPVFPCRESGAGIKRPYTTNGFYAATTDADQIRSMWAHYPNALAAAPTGPQSNFWVLDIDRIGIPSLADLFCGVETLEDLSPVWVRTPGGGLHIYFAFEPETTPRTRSSDIAQGVDTRGVGGYIILPGNVLPDGRAYRLGGSR